MIFLAKDCDALPVRQRNVFTVDYSALENFIADSFMLKFEFSIPADQESSNDTSVEVIVDGEVDSYDRNRIERFLEGKPEVFMLSALMNYLCLHGRLHAGEYIVRISW